MQLNEQAKEEAAVWIDRTELHQQQATGCSYKGREKYYGNTSGLSGVSLGSAMPSDEKSQ